MWRKPSDDGAWYLRAMKSLFGRLFLPLTVACVLGAVHCGDDEPAAPVASADAGRDADVGAGDVEADKPLVPATKVDLLLVVDNSVAMDQKQLRLAESIGVLFRRLAEPSGGHAPIRDIHVGVISSSLGTPGGDVCPPETDDKAHLLQRDGAGGLVPEATASGFLEYLPAAAGKLGSLEALEAATRKLILGVGSRGCGFEAQLESMYRFLLQPDPPAKVEVVDERVVATGIDEELLAQRKAFLRPDSAVVVVMITDEEDSFVDPRSVAGMGWAFNMRRFPGSLVSRGGSLGTTAPIGTSACATDPWSTACASCTFGCEGDPKCPGFEDDIACKTSGDPPQSGAGHDGYHRATEDPLTVRSFDMKRRFGVDPQFPIERYVAALGRRRVPKADTEHDANGVYVHAPTCESPLFAAALPGAANEELCNLPDGGRSRSLVHFALIGGVPSQLLGDWTKILGADPEKHDFAGRDPHMVPSIAPRPGLGDASAPRGDNGTDPMHGREWDTQGEAMQYACTFALVTPIVCTAGEPCDCRPDDLTNPPVCAGDDVNEVVRGRANPTTRELRVARLLGERGHVASICEADGHAGFMGTLDDRLAGVLAK